MFTPYPKDKVNPRPRADDPEDLRLGASVQWVDHSGTSGRPLTQFLKVLKPEHYVLIGYPDDRGVGRNGGRVGAKDGPDAIRRYLYNMTPSSAAAAELTIWDFGNLQSAELDLIEAQHEARKVISELRRSGARVISLGGGHEWAYPDFADFKNDFPAHSTALVNFDAHLDMRPIPDDPNLDGHSGLAFRKILLENAKTPITAIGLQRHCNAPSHLEWAKAFPVNTLFLEDLPLEVEAQLATLESTLGLGEPQSAGAAQWALSICMDAFPRSLAPGVSAPQAFGLDPQLALHFMRKHHAKIPHLGIYELNPAYDQDGATARLAARLVYEYLMAAL